MLKVGAYQFPTSGDIDQNLEHIKTGIKCAAEQDVRLLVFPECALTGYPPKDIPSVKNVDFDKVESSIAHLRKLSTENGIFLIFGTAEHQNGKFYSSANTLSPNDEDISNYRKRALWGWDLDNFSPGGNNSKCFDVDGYHIGVRICYEVRFPEYFRELYKDNVDLGIVLFSDTSDEDYKERYDLIKAHLLTRAVENVCSIVSVNNCNKWQTAPTIAINDGVVCAEVPRHQTGLLIYELQNREYGFSAKGRKVISDSLTKD